MKSERANIVIIGGGIVGLSCAEQLSRRAENIVIIDPCPPGKGASWGNMGAMAFGEVLPMARPAMIGQAARWLVDPLGPVSVSKLSLPRNFQWFKSFVAAAFDNRFQARVEALARLNALAEEAWQEALAGTTLMDRCLHDRIQHIYETREQFERDMHLWKIRERTGHPFREVAVSQAMSLGVAEAAIGAVLETPSWRLTPDPYLLSSKLEEISKARGVEILADEVTNIHERDERVVVSSGQGEVVCNTVVVAAGIGSRRMAAQLGDKVPLVAERGYSYTLPPGACGPDKYIVFRNHGFVVSPLECGVRIGGSSEFVDPTSPPNWDRLDVILEKAKRLIPETSLKRGRRWYGDRPSTPDSLPVIGRSLRSRNVIYAFGHGHLGVTQAAATARLVSDIVQDVPPPIDTEPYQADRFR